VLNKCSDALPKVLVITRGMPKKREVGRPTISGKEEHSVKQGRWNGPDRRPSNRPKTVNGVSGEFAGKVQNHQYQSL